MRFPGSNAEFLNPNQSALHLHHTLDYLDKILYDRVHTLAGTTHLRRIAANPHPYEEVQSFQTKTPIPQEHHYRAIAKMQNIRSIRVPRKE